MSLCEYLYTVHAVFLYVPKNGKIMCVFQLKYALKILRIVTCKNKVVIFGSFVQKTEGVIIQETENRVQKPAFYGF